MAVCSPGLDRSPPCLESRQGSRPSCYWFPATLAAGAAMCNASRAQFPMKRSARETLQLILRPGDHLLDRLAVLQPRHHLVVRWRGCRSAPRCPATPRRRSGWACIVPRPDRIVVHRARGRLDLFPDLEVQHAWHRAGCRSPPPPSSRASTCSRSIRKVSRSLAADWFLLNCQTPQKNVAVGTKRPFGPDRRREGPAIRGNLRRVALRHRPGRWRVEDQRALAGDQRAVVRGVVVAHRIVRIELHQLLANSRHCRHLGRVELDVAFLVDQHRAERLEQRADA